MTTSFVTGFPGFIATRLVERLAGEEESFVLLVEERFRERADEEADRIAAAAGLGRERFEIVVGDITRERLGLAAADWRRIARRCRRVFHLAAIYDLSVEADLAERVNVRGTENVNDLVRTLAEPEHYHYVSTFAVAGRRTGIVRENELVHEAGFFNHYESTKYRAEVAVDALRGEGLPVSIYRPGVVVGDSRDGSTAKFDGPYMMLEVMVQFPWPLNRLNFGSPDVRFQMVPIDFIISALSTIAALPDEPGRTYHLTDPDPHTTAEIFDLFTRELTGGPSYLQLPELATRAVTASGLTAWLGLQREANPYFFHQARFDCVNTLDVLDGTGVECPSPEEYVGPMVRYFLAHRGG